MKARPSWWNLRPLGQPSYCTTRSHSFCGEMRKMRPNGMSTIQRLPSRSNDGPSRKHSTSALWRFGSDQAVRLLLRNCAGRDVNTSALISSSGLNGLSMDAASFLCLGIVSKTPHPNRSPRLRRRRGHSLTCPLPPRGGKERNLFPAHGVQESSEPGEELSQHVQK